MGDHYQPSRSDRDRNDQRGYANTSNSATQRNSHNGADEDGRSYRRHEHMSNNINSRRDSRDYYKHEGGGRGRDDRQMYGRDRRDSRDYGGRRESMDRGGREGRGGSDRYDDRERNYNDHGRRRNDDYRGGGGGGGGVRSDEMYSKRRRMSEEDDFRRRHRPHHPRDDGDRRRRAPQKKQKPEWPAPFEDAGGNYVFDARSGLFYEAESDFFYDPKNKLYYSNEKKKYYRYCPDNMPKDENVFEEVNPDDSAISKMTGLPDQGNGSQNPQVIDASQDLVLQALQGGNSANASGKQDKKKINICIKKKFSGSANLKKKIIANEAAVEKQSVEEKESLAQKAHKADIEKWAKRAEENGEDDDIDTSRRIKMTKAGKPICCLCKRKFADIEKLRQHEKHSALHKQNLEKKRKLEEKNAEYRDRASERRTMYEVDTAVPVSTIDQSVVDMGPSLDKARTVTKTETVAPKDTLGEHNIGNQMLLKMGWKPKSNGPSSEHMEDKLAKLKQDWERIESLSGGKK